MLRKISHPYFNIIASILLLLMLFNGSAFAHWIESHEAITDLAIQTLERDSKSAGDKYKTIVEILKKYKTTLIQGVRDADLRANGIYAIDCQPDGKQCCEIADFSEFVVGDHGFNLESFKGLYRSSIEFTKMRDGKPMQKFFEDIFQQEPRSERANRLYGKLRGNTIAEKIESLKYEMDKSNAFVLGELFFNRALNEWKTNHPVDAIYNLGLALHLVQDLSVPHHVRLIDDVSHGEYEKYVWGNYLKERMNVSDRSGSYFMLDGCLECGIANITMKLNLDPRESSRDSVNLAIASSERLFMNFSNNTQSQSADMPKFVSTPGQHKGTLVDMPLCPVEGTRYCRFLDLRLKSGEVVRNDFGLGVKIIKKGQVIYDGEPDIGTTISNADAKAYLDEVIGRNFRIGDVVVITVESCRGDAGCYTSVIEIQDGPNTSSTNPETIIAIQKDNLENTGEDLLFPIAYIKNMQYHEISVSSLNEREATPKDLQVKAMLSNIKQYMMISDGVKTGTFDVSNVKFREGLSCDNAYIPAGKIHLIQKTANYGKDSNNTLFLSTGSTSVINSKFIPVKEIASSYMNNITNLLKFKFQNLRITNSRNIDTSSLKIEYVKAYDLENDGQPELFLMSGSMRLYKAVVTDEVGCSANDITLFMIIFLDRNQYRILYSSEPPYGTNLIGAADIDSDGNIEIVINNGLCEAWHFEIYRFQNGSLKKLYSGTEYGC